MKRRDLLKKLQNAGWSLSSGSKHDMVENTKYPGTKIPIPRHTEINEYLAQQILKEAGLK